MVNACDRNRACVDRVVIGTKLLLIKFAIAAWASTSGQAQDCRPGLADEYQLSPMTALRPFI